MKNESSTFAQFVFVSSIFIFMIFYNIVTWGLVLSKFWNWFLIPILNLTPITYYGGMGLALIASVFTNVNQKNTLYLIGGNKTKDKVKNDKIKVFLFFTSPWLTLLFAYFVFIFLSQTFDLF
ncbi:MAG: hypothetical protein M0R03_20685 [Novosphingobium sp.]|nr:hypothetical protein [Novosphingobium sp.]